MLHEVNVSTYIAIVSVQLHLKYMKYFCNGSTSPPPPPVNATLENSIYVCSCSLLHLYQFHWCSAQPTFDFQSRENVITFFV